MKTINCFIQARFNSVRLPGKVLKDIGGFNSLELIIKRLQTKNLFTNIIIVTGSKTKNKPVSSWAKENKIKIFHGDEVNVLNRFYQAKQKFESDYICRITADCPLVCLEIIEKAFKKLIKKELDYISNTLPPTFPDGIDFEIFKSVCIDKSLKLAKNNFEKEHVTPIMRNSNIFKKINLKNKIDHSQKRWTLDEENDYEFFKAFLCKIKDPVNADFKKLISIFQKNGLSSFPNQKIIRNEGALMSNNQKLYKRAKTVIPGGVGLLSKRPEMFLPDEWPTYFKKAKGIKVVDLDNTTFRDFSTMSVGACSLGYCNKKVDNKVIQSVNEGIMSTLNCFEEVILAEKLINIHPWADQVRYARTGGEANAIAVRLARAATNKNNILICGYHGWHDWYLALNLSKNDQLKDHLLPGLSSKGVNKKLQGTSNTFNYGNYNEFNKQINNDVAAVIMEPCRNSKPDKKFLKHVRKICSKNNIVLILDECSSGFRENFGGMHLKIGIEPDMVMYGKALSNGYALTAVLGRKEIMEYAQETFISSTFWTERIGPVAGIATLNEMERTKSYEYIPMIGRKIRQAWESLSRKNNIKIKTGGFDAIPNFMFETDRHQELKTYFTKLMLDKGYLATNSFYASTAHSSKEFNLFYEQLDKIFYEIAPYFLDKEKKFPNKFKISHNNFTRLN